MWPAIIAAGAALAGSALSNASNRSENKKAYERNLAMWNLENEYNHPVQQMARLREAGLNPNMVYDNGATTLAASTKASTPANVSFPQLDILSMANAYQDLAQKDAMTENIKAQAMKSAADALVAMKDYSTYDKTGVHPNRGIVNQFTNLIMDGVQRYAGPATDYVGDRITDFSRKWNSAPKTDILGNKLR